MFEHLIFELSACDKNKYGYGCKRTCGSCLYDLQCNKATGMCSNGCDTRKIYIPPLCQTSNNLLYDT